MVTFVAMFEHYRKCVCVFWQMSHNSEGKVPFPMLQPTKDNILHFYDTFCLEFFKKWTEREKEKEDAWYVSEKKKIENSVTLFLHSDFVQNIMIILKREPNIVY